MHPTPRFLAASALLALALASCAASPPVRPCPEPAVPVVAVTRVVQPGETLAADVLGTTCAPAPDDRTFPAALALIGRVPRERLLPGEPVRRERLADADAGQGLAALVPRGMEAQRIELPAGAATGLHARDYVDVIAVGPVDGAVHAEVLVRAVLVVAVHDAITVALTPEDAARVRTAATTGHFAVVARNPVDVTRITSPGPAARSPWPTGDALAVAAGDLYPGLTIADEDLVGATVPSGFPAPQSALGPEDAAGCVPVERILAGEPVRAERLADGAEWLAAVVAPGMRAITLPFASVDRAVKGGVHVDAHATVGGADTVIADSAFVFGVHGADVTLMVTPDRIEPLVEATAAPGGARLVVAPVMR
jgi:Flp pilus assembly protein CpaB